MLTSSLNDIGWFESPAVNQATGRYGVEVGRARRGPLSFLRPPPAPARNPLHRTAANPRPAPPTPPRETLVIERPQITGLLAHAPRGHRQPERFRQCHHDPATRAAVELGDHQ